MKPTHGRVPLFAGVTLSPAAIVTTGIIVAAALGSAAFLLSFS